MTRAEQIVKAAVDAAGEFGGLDEVAAIAAKGPGDLEFSAEDQAILLEEYGDVGYVLYTIRLEAQNRISANAIDPR